jgi:hypothetical protein
MATTRRRLHLALILLPALQGACGEAAPPPPPVEHDVYVAGRQWSDGRELATLWVNGVARPLGDGVTASLAAGVALDGDDVLVAGSVDTASGGAAVLWRNGIGRALPGLEPAMANDVAASGGDVYVVGYQGYEATLWKNGVAEVLPHQALSASRALSVAVSGTDVYVAGWSLETIQIDPLAEFTTQVARLWKNGVGTTLSDGLSPALAFAVAVDGGDVYVVGLVNTGGRGVATLWKNGVAQPLSTGGAAALATAVAVSGGVVHAAGGVGTGFADAVAVWRDGALSTLTDGSTQGFAEAVAVAGSDVYVVGYLGGAATSWKNGVATRLPDLGEGASAYDVAVRAR